MINAKTGFLFFIFVMSLIGCRPAFAQTNTPVTGIDLGGEIIEIIKQNPQDPTQAINNYMSGVAATNVRWVRIHLDWSAIQPASTWIFTSDPNPGRSSGLTWGATDIVVRAARNYGIRILGVITSTPRWATHAQCPSYYRQSTDDAYKLCAPNLTSYTNFARAAAKHYGNDSYGGKIDAWEIWNEPNCGPNFIPHDPVLYTRLVKSAYPAIKQANPSASVYAGGSSGCLTSPNNGTGALPSSGVAGLVNSTDSRYPAPTQWEPRDWLAVMYANGARGYFDGLAHHPHCHSDDWQLPGDQCPSTTVNSVYPDYSNPFNIMWHTFASPSYGWPAPTGKTFASYTGTSLRELMNANGDGGKPIVITEFGVATTASDGATDFTGQLGGSAQQYANADFQTIAPAYLTQANQEREYKALIAWIANQPYGQYGPVYAYCYSDMALSSPYSANIYEPYFGLVTITASTATSGTTGAPKIAGAYQAASGQYYPAWPNFGAAATAAANHTPGYAPVGPGW